MGTIAARKRKGGTTGYTVQILRKKGGAIVLREAKTFDKGARSESMDAVSGIGTRSARSPRPSTGEVIHTG